MVLMRSAGRRTLAEVEGASVRGVKLLRHLDDDQTRVEGLLTALLRDGAQEKEYDQQKPASRRRVPIGQRTLRWISTPASLT